MKEIINHILNHDSKDMHHIPNCSIDLIVTSPPYNVTKQYDDDLTLQEYLELLESVFKEAFRILKPGSIAALNIANVGRKPYLPLDCFIINMFQKIGFDIYDEIIWDKAASAGGSCAWGSWQSASNPSLRDVHEYIILARKPNGSMIIPLEPFDRFPEKIDNKSVNISEGEIFSNTWNFGTESAKRVNHPAPFPAELPFRIILLFSRIGDIVLDPFMGSGSVAIAAIATKRNYIGYDINQDYIDNANNRIKEFHDRVRGKKSLKERKTSANEKNTLGYYLK